jgi:hypothetical protein
MADIDEAVYLGSRDWSRLEAKNVSIDWWAHQRIALQRMKDFENGQMSTRIRVDSESKAMCYQIRLRMGVYCDPPGSGKTAVIMALVAFNDFQSDYNPLDQSVLQGMAGLCLVDARCKGLRDTTMIIVNHNLLSQWSDTAEMFGMVRGKDFVVMDSVCTLHNVDDPETSRKRRILSLNEEKVS